jgi:hypothetical protein
MGGRRCVRVERCPGVLVLEVVRDKVSEGRDGGV